MQFSTVNNIVKQKKGIESAMMKVMLVNDHMPDEGEPPSRQFGCNSFSVQIAQLLFNLCNFQTVHNLMKHKRAFSLQDTDEGYVS